MKKIASLLIVTIIITSFSVFVTANESIEPSSQDKLSLITSINSELSISEIEESIAQYAESENISYEESLNEFYFEAQDQQNENTNRSRRSSGEDWGAPGEADRAGDLMYTPAWTGFINHGHSAIYYTKRILVHAPGGNAKSHAIASSKNIGQKNKMKLQYVKTTQENRTKAANYAYNHLRDKPYDNNFASNKTTTTKLNCSGLVWNAYKKSVNIDLDSNGGPGVYPANIYNSPLTVTYATR